MRIRIQVGVFGPLSMHSAFVGSRTEPLESMEGQAGGSPNPETGCHDEEAAAVGGIAPGGRLRGAGAGSGAGGNGDGARWRNGHQSTVLTVQRLLREHLRVGKLRNGESLHCLRDRDEFPRLRLIRAGPALPLCWIFLFG